MYMVLATFGLNVERSGKPLTPSDRAIDFLCDLALRFASVISIPELVSASRSLPRNHENRIELLSAI
jgi:hypothetical protein